MSVQSKLKVKPSRWSQVKSVILASLIGMAVTSPVFQLFILEESMQTIGFGVSAWNFNKVYTQESCEAMTRAESLMRRADVLAKLPVPIVGLVASYYLFFESAWFNFNSQRRVHDIQLEKSMRSTGESKAVQATPKPMTVTIGPGNASVAQTFRNPVEVRCRIGASTDVYREVVSVYVARDNRNSNMLYVSIELKTRSLSFQASRVDVTVQ